MENNSFGFFPSVHYCEQCCQESYSLITISLISCSLLLELPISPSDSSMTGIPSIPLPSQNLSPSSRFAAFFPQLPTPWSVTTHLTGHSLHSLHFPTASDPLSETTLHKIQLCPTDERGRRKPVGELSGLTLYSGPLSAVQPSGCIPGPFSPSPVPLKLSVVKDQMFLFPIHYRPTFL